MEAALFAGRSFGRSVGVHGHRHSCCPCPSSFLHTHFCQAKSWFCFGFAFVVLRSLSSSVASFLTTVEDCSIFLACFGRVLGSYSSAFLQVSPP
jgi:hypothetical protein